MDNYIFKNTIHRCHALINKAPRKSLLVTIITGLLCSLSLIALTAAPKYSELKQKQKTTQETLQQTKETTAKLLIEKTEQQIKLRQMTIAPVLALNTALNSSSYTEEDTQYWRKQMDAFSQMTGIRLLILGKGTSQYDGATKITVSIKSDNATPLAQNNIAKALDFLQIYGYIETFDGTEAVIHIKGT